MRIERPATIEMIAARNLFNVTIIGDGTAGVMHMLVTYTENRFPQHYCPTVVDSPICDVLIDGTMVRLKLWPAPGLSLLFVPFQFYLKILPIVPLISYSTLQVKRSVSNSGR